MSTDRELLEAAAKAAGYMPARWTMGSEWPEGLLLEGIQPPWNPLTDDGDALGLAVKLDMSVEVSSYEASTYVFAGDVPRTWAMEMWRGEKEIATRRAIVRAAAALGAAK